MPRDRAAEYAKRAAKRASAARPEPLPAIYPELQHGVALSFWDDELRMDIAQERALAGLEGRDPSTAAHAYAKREKTFRKLTRPMPDEL